jgi:hypothetical protein
MLPKSDCATLSPFFRRFARNLDGSSCQQLNKPLT